jgi:hypothetical protein
MDSIQHATEALYATGCWLLESHRAADAKHVFRALVMAAPLDERGWLGLGLCHESTDEDADAIALYRLGAANTRSVRCLVATARVLRRAGDDAGADDSLDAAERLAEQPDLLDLVHFERKLR